MDNAFQSPKRALLLIGAFTLAVTVGLCLILLFPSWEGSPLPETEQELKGMSETHLENEKLRQEILQLVIENRTRGSFWGLLLSYVPLLAALATAFGLLVTIWKHISDRNRQLEQDRLQREAESLRRTAQEDKDRLEREAESRRRFDENFNSVVQNLGSESPGLQASAAVSLATFLKPEYKEFHSQIHMVVVANLKIEHEEAVRRLLIRVFEQSLRSLLGSCAEADRPYLLDLSRACLYRVDLSGMNLAGADLAYANLSHASVTDADLFRVEGIGVKLERARLSRSKLEEVRLQKALGSKAQFHGTRLVSARLEQADLTGAQFQEATLQSAHLDEAILKGARFEGAELNDAFFRKAVLDDTALRSIARGARHWRKAHFDPDVVLRLEAISEA